MKYTLVPSLIAHSQEELDERLSKIAPLRPARVQLDIMDGQLVKHTSLEFDFILSKKFKREAHLMITDPHPWILAHNSKVEEILIHYESKAHLHDCIKSVHMLKKRIGIAINPSTPIEALSQYIPFIDKLLIMTVEPGAYGSKFVSTTLAKIAHARELAPKMDIEVDGGITPATLTLCKKKGANQFVIGSYIQKAKDSRKAWKELIHALN